MEHIKNSIARACAQTAPINRLVYMPYQMEIALSVVYKIGRSLCPTFTIDNENRFVFENLIRWVHGDVEFKCLNPDNRTVRHGNLNAGIYLAGGTGTGKSLALEVMSRYSRIDRVVLYILGNPILLSWKLVGTSDITDAFLADGDIKPYVDRAVIAFNDLGAEPLTSIYMGNRVDIMRTILERRADKRATVTLITSNYPLSNIASIYGDRVQSRLYEMCNYFELTGTDRRKVKS